MNEQNYLATFSSLRSSHQEMRQLFSIFLILPLMVCAQVQHNHWFMGFNAALDFSGGAPTPIVGNLSTDEGCTSIADSSGQLLFFTNGEQVWDANQNVMPNGSGLLGHFSSSQSALIVPLTGQPDLYYIFTAPAGAGQWTPTDIGHYHLVDMSLNNGLGDVLTKNTPLAGPLCEKLTATRHANGKDTWVLFHGWDSDAYYAYLVTCEGIQGPVVSNIGYYLGPDAMGYSSHVIGCMKLNRQGTKLATGWTDPTLSTQQVFESQVIVDALDFDNQTGLLSNLLRDTLGTGTDLEKGYGVEFSPNGELFYLTDHGIFGGGFDARIYQYNLSNVDPMNSEILIASGSPAYGSLQLGPDDALYAARLNGANYLSKIEFPDVVGLGCSFVNVGPNLGNGVSTWGLPNHWDSYLPPPVIDPVPWTDSTICSGNILIDAFWQHPFDVPTYLWSTGETSSSITVEESGTYSVEIMLACSTVYDTVRVQTGGITVNLGQDRSICTGEQTELNVSAIQADILWSTGDTTDVLTIKEVGEYSVQLTDSTGCVSGDTIQVQMRNCQCPMYVPNAFTPNGDGNNDVFSVSMDCEPTAFELIIFDRWGSQIHRSQNTADIWTGEGAPLGVYVFKLTYEWDGMAGQEHRETVGHVTLVR